jgi:hypothetical protein
MGTATASKPVSLAVILRKKKVFEVIIASHRVVIQFIAASATELFFQAEPRGAADIIEWLHELADHYEFAKVHMATELKNEFCGHYSPCEPPHRPTCGVTGCSADIRATIEALRTEPIQSTLRGTKPEKEGGAIDE